MADIHPIDLLDPDAQARAQEWVDVHAAGQRELFGEHGSAWTLAEIQLFHRADHTRRRAWGAVEDGHVVGSVELVETVRDNLGSASIWLGVHPLARRRGLGTVLLETAESAARAAGRQALLAETEWAEGGFDVSAPFAQLHGYAVAQTNLRSALALPADADHLALLRDGRAGCARGDGDVAEETPDAAYRVEVAEGLPPAEWHEDLAVLNRRMSTDAPLGDLALEEEDWDAERVRAEYERRLGSGRQIQTAVARESASGRLVGFTDLSISAGSPELAYQGSTLVLREHRGHRLGLRLKAANALAVMASLPDVRSIRTWNADDNAPMLAVNQELGFTADAVHRMWQKRV